VIVVERHLSNLSAISWLEQVNFQGNDDEVRFVLDQHTETTVRCIIDKMIYILSIIQSQLK
jgi:hypothetical protein